MSWEQDEIVTPAPQQSRVQPQQQGGGWEGDEVISPAPAQPNASAPAHQAQASGGRGLAGEVARQVGLTVRHGLEGVGQAAEIVTEPIRQFVTDPAMNALGVKGKGLPMGQVAGQWADALGLPKPENAQERIVGDATRFMAGGAGVAGAAGKAAGIMQSGPLRAATQMLAANPGVQVAGAAGAGAASGAAREAGGDGLAQGASALAGGIAAGAVAGGVSNMAQRVAQAMQAGDERLAAGLSQSGIDLQGLSADAQNRLREQAQQAMQRGQLDSAALGRLADFERVGATPTRGTLTLDPVQITREQNLARMGANASDSGLHGLAKVQHENNRALIDSINKLGAAAPVDAHAAGAGAIGVLERGLNAEKSVVGQLYQQARDSAGRSLSLDGHAFTQQASKLLDEGLLGGALPPSVEQHLNRIAKGEVPFTVDYAEQLKTAIGKLQRATADGQSRMALGVVRQALDDTPLLPSEHAAAGREALSAFNRARIAHKTMMKRIESIPGLKAVYDGKATADDFVQKHIISRSAKAQDTSKLADHLRQADPETFESVRASLAQHLKSAALGSASDEVGRFSAAGYNRARLALGDRKLAQFFSKDEMAQLKAIGKVSEYVTAQPAGSAVNNSNSGAMLAGRGLDLLNRLAGQVPLLGVGPTMASAARGLQQRQALQIDKALVRHQPKPPSLPAATQGVLMSSVDDAP